MTLNEFKDWALAQGSVAKYDDGQYKGQCVSLINQYCYRVLGVSVGDWGNAKDWPSNPYVLSYFDKVSSPQAGDIGVLGGNVGNGFGHIFIYLSTNQILEQNGRLPLKVSLNNPYSSPIAILRKKGSNMLTKEQIIVIYALAFEVEDWQVPQDLINAYTGKPLDGLLTQLHQDPSWQAHKQATNNPPGVDHDSVIRYVQDNLK